MKPKEKLIYLYIAIAISVLFFLSAQKGFFSRVELSLEDTLFGSKSVENNIAIIAIDDASIAEIGQWPWPREVYSRLFLKLSEVSPKAVGFDVMLSERSRQGASDDIALANALSKIDYPLIFPIEVRASTDKKSEEVIKPLPEFKGENLKFGHVNMTLDPDGVVRRFPLSLSLSSGEKLEAFSALTVSSSGKEITVPYESSPRIVFAGGPESVKTYSFKDILESDDLRELKNNIIFIGATAPDLHDERITPTSRRGALMSGVEVHAQIANMLLEDLSLLSISPIILFLWILCLSLLVSILFILRLSPTWIIVNVIIAGGISLGLSVIAFEKGIIVNIIHTEGALLLSLAGLFTFRYTLGEKEKKILKNTFGKYVSPQVLEKIMENPEKVELGGEEKIVTVLFSDIRGFTTLSEATEPAELVGILNEYFTEMTNEVLKYGGVLDKYIGDAVMAFWGAPLPDDNQADNALKAAIGMVKSLHEFNKKLAERGKPQIKNGVGLYTGPAIVGNVGSTDRFDYTVIGDTVNTASRLESSTKEFGVSIILGEPTYKSLKENFSVKKLGVAKVKGKTEELQIYTVDL